MARIFDNIDNELPSTRYRHATDQPKRARLCGEFDGLVANLYRLTEAEFAHILRIFALVAESAEIAAHHAYGDVEEGLTQ